MTHRILSMSAAAVLFLGTAGNAAAQTASVTYEITAINETTFTGTPAKLLIDAAADMAGVSDMTTTWAVTTNQTNMAIQGAVSALPAGVTLEVELEAPAAAGVATKRALTVSAQDLVTGITTLAESGLMVTYTLSATPAAGVVAEQVATVTYTVVAGI